MSARSALTKMSHSLPAGQLPRAGRAPNKASRIEALDLARGIAVFLMIISHGVKGLMAFESFEPWGLVPIHLVTKFSSSLFIMVFGVSLALIYLPHVGTAAWGQKRRRLLLRGLTVLFWYKVLTVVEMFQLHPRTEIIDTLMYKAFPSYVEILGFYGLALLWIPHALSLWKKTPTFLRVCAPVALWMAVEWLSARPELFPSPQLQALLIEHDDYYTWGQLSRAPLVFLGLLTGQALQAFGRKRVSEVLMGAGVLLLAGFFYRVYPSVGDALKAVALNKGKHPPELDFMLFSMGGALFIFGACLYGGNLWANRLAVIKTLGKDAMGAFVFHISVIFIVYRFLFDCWLKVPYEKALALAVLLVFMTAAWIKVKKWVQA